MTYLYKRFKLIPGLTHKTTRQTTKNKDAFGAIPILHYSSIVFVIAYRTGKDAHGCAVFAVIPFRVVKTDRPKQQILPLCSFIKFS